MEMPDNLQFDNPSGEVAEYLEKYYKTSFRTGTRFVTCGGTLFPQTFAQFGNRIYNMKVRSDDVWVCSFPRTGTTWSQEMVWCISNNVDVEAATKNNLTERFPYIEGSSLYDFQHLQKFGAKTCPDVIPNDTVDCVEHLASPRFIKSHIPFKLLPKELQQNEAKIIYVTRHPGDTCISSFYHTRKYYGYTGTLEQYCEAFLKGNTLYGPFWSHVRSFWEIRNERNVLVLKYEDMIKDLKSVIYKTANFLEKSLNEEQVAQLLSHLSFNKMKENSALNRELFDDYFSKHGLLPNDYKDFLRSGKVGEWKKVMDAKLAQRFEEWQQENLRNADKALVEFFNGRT